MTCSDDAAAQVDVLMSGIGPGLRAPAVQHRDRVLVTGPWLAGVSGLVAALRARSPGRVFVEADELGRGEAPMVVVFVVSAAAALTESDCALLDAAAAHTDAVIAAVSKIDVHRSWRDLLAVGRATLATHAPRYRDVPWVGVAAAPAHGEPRIDELLAELSKQLIDPGLARRNRLRTWETRLRDVADRYDRDAVGDGRRARVALLQGRRDTARRQHRLARSERTVALRSQLQQARVQLAYAARNRCATLRSDLQEEIASTPRRGLPGFATRVRRRVTEVIDEIGQDTCTQLAGIADGLGLPTHLSAHLSAEAARPTVLAGDPPLRWRRLETRLMLLLGAGFGLGVALTVSRLFTGLAPGFAAAGAVAGALVGLAVTVGVVGIRRLLHDRAVLDRWVGEVAASLRSAADQLVATRVLAAESVLTAALAEREEAAGQRVAEQVRAIDGELRAHAVAAARAAAQRDRAAPTLRDALAAVRSELNTQFNQATAAPQVRPIRPD